MNRRTFTKTALLLSGFSALSTKFPFPVFANTIPKNILVLGGTYFLGPATVQAALAAGHNVTLFNRGITNPELFPHLEKLKGLRSARASEQNVAALMGRHWDAVIDVWPHDPAIVASAAELLRDKTKHYLYVSSVAAYDPKEFAHPGITEDASLRAWTGSAGDYGCDKAESERRLQSLIGPKLTIVRPGGIKGARDDTPGDLLSWLRRLQEEQRLIAPGDGTGHVQIVDLKDVARFLVLAIDQSIYGTFNLTGAPMTFREFLEECKAAIHSNAELVWIPEDFLREHGLGSSGEVRQWRKTFPYWNPDPARRGFFQISNQRAVNAGWKTIPFRDTAMDFLEYFGGFYDKGAVLVPSQDGTYEWKDALPRAKEREVLELWDHH